jgi:hypothetical protein
MNSLRKRSFGTGIGLLAISGLLRAAESFVGYPGPFKADQEVAWGDSLFDKNKIGVVLEAFEVGKTPSKKKYPALLGEILPADNTAYVVEVTEGNQRNRTGELHWLSHDTLRAWSMNILADQIAVDSCKATIETYASKVEHYEESWFDLSTVSEDPEVSLLVERSVFYLEKSMVLDRDDEQPNFVHWTDQNDSLDEEEHVN